jgi:hypothetical protein
MPKQSVPPALDIGSGSDKPAQTTNHPPLSPSTLSLRSSRSPRSNPGSPNLKDNFDASFFQSKSDRMAEAGQAKPGSISPSITAIPQYPPSPPKTSPKHQRDASRSFFSNLVASKSSHRLQALEQGGSEEIKTEPAVGRGRTASKDEAVHAPRGQSSGSDLQRNNHSTSEVQRDQSVDRAFSGSDTSSQPLEATAPPGGQSKKPKPRFGLLNRSKSIRSDDHTPPCPSIPAKLDLTAATSPNDGQFPEAMKTAPLRTDHRERTFGEPVGSALRNRSADRPPVPSEHAQDSFPPRHHRNAGSLTNPISLKEAPGSHLLSNIQQTGKGAADRLGKAGKGLFGRITRTGSTHERELVTDDNYTCTTITMPLVQQTRRTRIAKRLELSRDKTEFWMPALPWRCIE